MQTTVWTSQGKKQIDSRVKQHVARSKINKIKPMQHDTSTLATPHGDPATFSWALLLCPITKITKFENTIQISNALRKCPQTPQYILEVHDIFPCIVTSLFEMVLSKFAL